MGSSTSRHFSRSPSSSSASSSHVSHRQGRSPKHGAAPGDDAESSASSSHSRKVYPSMRGSTMPGKHLGMTLSRSFLRHPALSLSQLLSGAEVRCFSAGEIAGATANLKHPIGAGGFGSVYQGHVLDTDTDSGVPVAVKVLHNETFESTEELLKEVLAVAALTHPFTLKLLGYCMEGCKALVYEYMPGGDVDKLLLKCEKGAAEFPWGTRLSVACACAEALAFMHSKKIIHRDFKASNVLLDKDMVPRVADFGLVKSIGDLRSHVTTRVKGSIGYIDPMYFVIGHVHAKSDVYAFGVFLGELLTGKTVHRHAIHENIIPDLVAARLENGAVRKMLDPHLGALDSGEEEQALGMVEIIRDCLKEKWGERPTMDELVRRIRGLLTISNREGAQYGSEVGIPHGKVEVQVIA